MTETDQLKNSLAQLVKKGDSKALFEAFMLTLDSIDEYVSVKGADINAFIEDSRPISAEYKNRDTNIIRIMLFIYEKLKDDILTNAKIEKLASDQKYSKDMIEHAKDRLLTADMKRYMNEITSKLKTLDQKAERSLLRNKETSQVLEKLKQYLPS